MSDSFRPAYGAYPPEAVLRDGAGADGLDSVVTEAALSLIADLSRAHGDTRHLLLDARAQRRDQILKGFVPKMSEATVAIREAEWTVAPIPSDLTNRRVEITGPANAKLMVSALNSGASVFMADLEDSLSPSWSNIVGGHKALRDAAHGVLRFKTESGDVRTPNDDAATLTVRPRGLHLCESHVTVDGQPVAACLFDVALLGLNVAAGLTAFGSGLYIYLPKLENHREAQWWDAVLADVERRCGLGPNTIRVTVLIEHVLAAFEMDEILFTLRDRITGLNAGRWDYLFSLIRDFGSLDTHVLPDRKAVTMAAPFMAAYSTRLVATCHRRGAYAIGGMSALIPDRSSPELTTHAVSQVQEEKRREASLGYDGAWVAHPDLVASVMEVFDAALGDRSDQREVVPTMGDPSDLLQTDIPDAVATMDGFANNVRVAFQYTISWLGGNGAVAIDHVMEDAATAEIARCQVWQLIHHETVLSGGAMASRGLASSLLDESADRLRADGADPVLVTEAAAILREAMLETTLPPFLTLLAYPYLTK